MKARGRIASHAVVFRGLVLLPPHESPKKRLRGRLEAAGRVLLFVFECLETLMKHDAQVFEIASQSRLRNKRK